MSMSIVVMDPSVVRAAQAGDERALERLLDGLAARLLPHASALTGGGADCDELLADTLSRVADRLTQLSEPEAVFSWARRALVRMFIDAKRLRLRRPTCSIETVDVPAPTRQTEDALDLQRAVTALPRAERALVVLHYWERLSLSECAAELGIPAGTAKSRLASALRRLRVQMQEDV
jgi:RNA polymerase sigma-70 factor (ECF subfamily)